MGIVLWRVTETKTHRDFTSGVDRSSSPWLGEGRPSPHAAAFSPGANPPRCPSCTWFAKRSLQPWGRIWSGSLLRAKPCVGLRLHTVRHGADTGRHGLAWRGLTRLTEVRGLANRNEGLANRSEMLRVGLDQALSIKVRGWGPGWLIEVRGLRPGPAR